MSAEEYNSIAAECTRGESDPRAFQLVAPGSGAILIEVMIYRQYVSDRRSLVIVSSVDYPMPPSEQFCDLMWDSGLQVIFIRRPGFGNSPELPGVLLRESEISNGAAVTTEAALLVKTLNKLQLKNVILIGLGTSNPVCLRLAKLSSEIELLICANPVFNQQILEVFNPVWFRTLLGLILKTRTGVKIAEVALKHQLRKDPLKFYQDVLEKCPGDWQYAQDNKADLLEACRLLLNVSPDTFLYDVRMSLLPDSTLRDDFFSDLNAVILSGQETSDEWKRQLNKEARRLGLQCTYAPSGDMLVPYVSPESLLDLIQSRLSESKRLPR